MMRLAGVCRLCARVARIGFPQSALPVLRRCSKRVLILVLVLSWAGACAGDTPAAGGQVDASAAESKTGGPSRLKAIGASLLLPGLGQLVTGHPGRAKAFFVTEGAILITFITLTVQGNVRRDGYIGYAETFAGVSDIDGKPDWYYSNLAEYRHSDDYVDAIQRTARAMFGNDLEKRQEYVEQNRPGSDEVWEWRSEADRQEFRSKRKASRNAFRSANHMLGAALLNRLLSAVDAAILSSRGSDNRTVYYEPQPDGPGYLCVRWALD
jgi:hypothetical protein